jgi:hypothetical protein
MITSRQMIESLSLSIPEVCFKIHNFLADWSENGGSGGAGELFILLKRFVPKEDWYYGGRGYRFLTMKPELLINVGVAKDVQEATDITKIDKNKFKRFILDHELGRGKYASWCWSTEGLSKEVSNQGGLYDNWLYFIKTNLRDGIELERVCYWLKRTAKVGSQNPDNDQRTRQKLYDVMHKVERFIDDFGSNFEVLAPINSEIQLYRIDSPSYYDEFGEWIPDDED